MVIDNATTNDDLFRLPLQLLNIMVPPWRQLSGTRKRDPFLPPEVPTTRLLFGICQLKEMMVLMKKLRFVFAELRCSMLIFNQISAPPSPTSFHSSRPKGCQGVALAPSNARSHFEHRTQWFQHFQDYQCLNHKLNIILGYKSHVNNWNLNPFLFVEKINLISLVWEH